MNKITIGAHVSAAGGCYRALKNAHNLGISALQMFGSSPKQYNVRVPSEDDVARFKELRKEYDITNVFLHAPYLVNLASQTPFVRHKSRETLAGHLQIAEMLQADGAIFHIGSVGVGGDKDEGIERVIKGVEKIYQEKQYSSLLIIENGSGGGGKIGASIQEMATIVNGVKNGEVGVCLDTAHIFASGELDFKEERLKEFWDAWSDSFDDSVLKVLHINDSKAALGSFVDRHENIGEGLIGKDGFSWLSQHKQPASVPWVLEVPGLTGTGPDRENIEILEEVVKS